MSEDRWSVWRNGTVDWVVARTPEEAHRCSLEAIGEDPSSYDNDFERMGDDELLTIMLEPGARDPKRVTKTCREWVAEQEKRPAVIATTEF